MPTLFIAIFIAVVAVLVVVQRRRLAQMQAMTLGGSIGPGCVVVEAAVLLLIAIAFAVAYFSGLS
jgi:hypothetical protein